MSFDTTILKLINRTWSNAAFDLFFPWWTNFQRTPIFWWFLLPVLLVATFYLRRWAGLAILLIGVVGTWLAEEFATHFIKPMVLRPRPFKTDLPFELITRIPLPGGTSFPSSHALDAFFLATFLSFQFPKLKWVFFALAFLTMYSRVYCGVHFPTDVLGGALIGAVLGACFAWAIGKVRHLRSRGAA